MATERKMMVRENLIVDKTRYLCLRVNRLEIYTEELPPAGSMRAFLKDAKERLKKVKSLFPAGRWEMKIEQQWKENCVVRYQSMNVLTGKLDESIA